MFNFFDTSGSMEHSKMFDFLFQDFWVPEEVLKQPKFYGGVTDKISHQNIKSLGGFAAKLKKYLIQNKLARMPPI